MKRTYIEKYVFEAFSTMNGVIQQDTAGLILSALIFIKLYNPIKWDILKEKSGLALTSYINKFFQVLNIPFHKIFDFKELDSDLLKSLIIILDKSTLRIQGDVLGDVYNFCKSDKNRKIYGEHYTAYNVVILMLNALNIKEDDIILDPCTGTGRMLTIANEVLPFKNLNLIGQEKNLVAWVLAEMSKLLYNSNLRLRPEPQDALMQLVDMKVNHVIMNPPFNQSCVQEILDDSPIWYDESCRKSNLNFVWLQLALHYLSFEGDAAVILPQTSLSIQQKEDITARRMIIDNQYLSGIICLPRGSFPSTRIKPCIWILSKKKSNLVYMVDIFNFSVDSDIQIVEDKNGNILNKLGLVEKQAKYRMVSIEEIKNNSYNLQPEIYFNSNMQIKSRGKKKQSNLATLISQLNVSQKKIQPVDGCGVDDQKKSYLLKDIAKVKYGRTAPAAINGTIPVYKSGHSRFKQEFTDCSMYEKESVIIGCKGTLSVQYAPGPFWASGTTFYLIINTDLVIPKYLFYLLRKIDLKKYNKASGLPSLRRVDLEKIELQIPSIAVQKQIVRKMEYLEEICECSREVTSIIEATLEDSIHQL